MFIDVLHDINQYNDTYITVVLLLLLFEFFFIKPEPPKNGPLSLERIFKRVVEFKTRQSEYKKSK